MPRWLISMLMIGCIARAAIAQKAPQLREPLNVVLIAIDTLRSDHLGCYGYARDTTPNLDRFAAEGVLFELCYSPASWTLPSFVSMFTGVHPLVHGCTNSSVKIPESIGTLPEQFKSKGYFCGAVVSNPCINGKYGFTRGFDVYDDYSVFLDAELELLAPINLGNDRGTVNDLVTGESVTQQAISVLSQARGSGKPFFMFVHYFDPHDSYVAPAPLDRRYDPGYSGRMDGRNVGMLRDNLPPARDIENLIARYDGEIRYNDAQVGRFLEELDTLNKNDTLIIFVSDHGEAFGEHGRLLHGNAPYAEEVRVPMIWRWPNVLPAGYRVSSPVSTIDIPDTLRLLFGFANLAEQQGYSLWNGLTGGSLPADRAVFSDRAFDNGTSPQLLIAHNGHHFHSRFTKTPENESAITLFQLQNDAAEQQDIALSTREIANTMNSELKAFWTECAALKGRYRASETADMVELTDQERQRLKGLGYIQPGGH